ncbi:MAG: insulinase family protein [Hymenobacteraceae bacterium]|nr:insulinase family protein [Hymenobacteraceae bacterium]
MNKPFALAAVASILTLTDCRAPQPAASITPPSAPMAATPAPAAPKKYQFQEVPNDPLHTRVYTLDNGLTVYLSDYKDAPRIQTYIAVRAGSKNDPHTATGLAHYLEHILFKGTSKLGTQDWTKEKVELDKIEALYNVYRTKTDTKERTRLYHQIDSISGVAATYAVANEYDKMMSVIGARGTNAHTWLEETVYQEDIPANEVRRWAMVQSERFRELTPRLFHTELEAVYEEKNRGLDSDGNKQFETLLEELFKKHEYGTQTTIGTIEHLKNPSITEIKKYFSAYYMPNNVAITMSGDLDYDQTIKIIDEQFGAWKASPNVPVFTAAQEAPLTAPVERTVVGPEAESLIIGFRLPGQLHPDALALRMVDRILANGQAGLIDLDLNQQQKVLSAGSGAIEANDYSVEYLSANLRTGQTMQQARDLLLGEVAKVKKGDFADWLIPAIVTNERLGLQKSYQSNQGRASAMYGAFIARENWQDYVSEDERFARLTKQQVVEVANRYFGNGYVIVYKKVGKDQTTQKVTKPTITPVPVNRAVQSKFAAQVMSEASAEIQPTFLDYQKDIERAALKSGAQVLATRNTENKLFSLGYVFETGTDVNPRLGLALDYLKFLGDDQHTAAQLQQEFYKLGCSFDVNAGGDQTRLTLVGPDENFDKGLALFEHFIRNPRADEKALKDLVAGVLKDRADAKRSKGVILQRAMVNYAKYGPKNPFTNLVGEKELKAMKPAALLAEVKTLISTEHRALYYGPRPAAALATAVDAVRTNTPALKPAPAVKDFAEREITKPTVYWANYDMVQAELMFLTRAQAYDKNLVPSIAVFNEYFGGGMGSIVFQELRESKALAYSTYSNYANARKLGRSNYIQSYIGAQADKLPEAMAGMEGLLNEMPLAEANFTNAKSAIRSNIAADRVTRENILYSYESARRLGLDYDIRKDIYAQAATMSFDDLKRFQQQNVRQKPQAVLLVGSKDRLNFKELAKYGTVKELSLTELFGY